MTPLRAAVVAVALGIGVAVGFALHDHTPRARARILTVTAAPARARTLPARTLAAGLPGRPLAAVPANDNRLWVLLAARDGGRVVRILRHGRPRTLPFRIPAPVELIGGSRTSPYLAYAGRREVGAINRFGQVVVRQPVRDAQGIAYDAGRIWYADRGDGLVLLSPNTGAEQRAPVDRAERRRLGDVAPGPTLDTWVRDDTGRLAEVVVHRPLRWRPVTAPGPALPSLAGTLTGDPRTSGAWATWSGGLVHVDARGDVTTLRLPPGFGVPGQVLAGPDGSVWVAAARGPRLARVGSDGSVAPFRLAIPSSSRITDLGRMPSTLLVATAGPNRVYAVALPDLRSRLSAGP